MKRVVTNVLFSFLLFVFTLIAVQQAYSQSQFRRGSSVNNNIPRNEFYVVDSDDNLPNAPTSNFIDTTFGTWRRLHFTNSDEGWDTIPKANPIMLFPFYLGTVRVDGGMIPFTDPLGN